MGFLDELKKLARPYDEDEDDYMDDAEVVDTPEERPRPNPFAGFGGSGGAHGTAGKNGKYKSGLLWLHGTGLIQIKTPPPC